MRPFDLCVTLDGRKWSFLGCWMKTDGTHDCEDNSVCLFVFDWMSDFSKTEQTNVCDFVQFI